jgi:hypothetical protein
MPRYDLAAASPSDRACALDASSGVWVLRSIVASSRHHRALREIYQRVLGGPLRPHDSQGTSHVCDAVLAAVARGTLVVLEMQTRSVVMTLDHTEPFFGAASDGEKSTFVEVVLLDAKGKPVANERYLITLPSGEVREGRLDTRGHVRIEDVIGDDFTVAFPGRQAA